MSLNHASSGLLSCRLVLDLPKDKELEIEEFSSLIPANRLSGQNVRGQQCLPR